MRLNLFVKYFSAVVLSLGVSSSALADIVTFDIQWSGLSFGNKATAAGFITFDNTQVRGQSFNLGGPFPSSTITNLQVTIANATTGNGTFGVSDFRNFYFSSPSVLDFSKELIGQPVSNSCNYGTSTGACGNGVSGDFNLFGNNPSAPTGTYYFKLTAAGGDNLLVTSFAPEATVPEPTTVALLGLGLLGFSASRRKPAKTAQS